MKACRAQTDLGKLQVEKSKGTLKKQTAAFDGSGEILLA